jgi:hypothetical protein
MADQKQDIKISLAADAKAAGTYSNAVSVHVNPNEVVLDFAYALPNTNPTEIQIVQRINLNHRTAESFISVMQNAILDYRNKMKEAEAAQAQQAVPQTPPQA